jgi:hypothetical protein
VAKSTKDEENLVLKFTVDRPYPEKDGMISALPVYLATEYAHDLMKQIYENINCQQV